MGKNNFTVGAIFIAFGIALIADDYLAGILLIVSGVYFQCTDGILMPLEIELFQHGQ